MPIRFRAGAIALAALIWAPAPEAAGQQGEDPQIVRFRLADTLLRSGQFDQAIGLLEELYAEAPQNDAFYAKLRAAYESVKRYEDAASLVGERLAQARTAARLSDLARIRFLQGNEEEARAAWREAVDTAPADPNSWRIVYGSLVGVRQFEYAISMLEEARSATGQPALFRVELAELCSVAGLHEKAAKEYLALLKENERHLNFARSRLGSFMEQEEALEATLAAAQDAVRADSLRQAWREFLGWLHMEANDFGSALGEYRAVDELEGGQGRRLFEFADVAADAGAYDKAAEAYREVLRKYPDAPAAPRALAAVGAMHIRRAEEIGERAFDENGARIAAPRYDEALAAYRTFLRRYPNHALYPDALHRIGRLQQDVFLDADSAEATFEQVVAGFPNTRAADQAAFDLAGAAIAHGDLDDARLRFHRLAERLRTGDLAEQSRFELAALHMFAGEFDAALSLVDIIDSNTSTDISNDAIALKILLFENRGPDSLDSPLRRYAGALLARKQRRPLVALDSTNALLAEHPGHALDDEARFLRGELLSEIGRTQEAFEAFAEIPLMHPASFLADRALFEAAGILAREPDKNEEAIAAYQRLLSDYPGSLFANKARDHIRRLRGDGA